jgi:hypothetical protein
MATYGSWAIGLMLATLALASLVSTYLLPETSRIAIRSIRRPDDASVGPELEVPGSGW